MTGSSRKAKVLPKNVPELDPTNSRYPSFNYPRSRIELASVLAIMTQFWRIRCIGNRKEESENGSFWSASVQSHSWLAFDNFFLHINSFRLFLLLLQLDHLSTFYSLLFSKLREKTQGMAVLTRREVDKGMLRIVLKVELLPFFRCWFKRPKEGLDPPQWTPLLNWISIWWIYLSFSFETGGRGCH